ncbi:MAG TPA: dihydrolipoamide acetyltransferase family protein [Oscillospiraceae bacterium]|nr:dihydrolipoamide acetyltransferase family protein [Oscillospiraceae bacterium]
MLTEILMPKFGLTMEDGTIEEWTVEIGQKVNEGDILAEVSTDKITNTVLSPADGYIRKFLAEVGDTIDCGLPIALMTDTADEELTEKADVSAATAEPESVVEADTPVVDTPVPTPVTESNVKITPRAKKIAEERGLIYTHITGTGRLGAITVDDLKKHGKLGVEAAQEVFVAPAPVAPVAVTSSTVVAASLPGSEVSFVRKLSPAELATSRTMRDSLVGSAQTTIATEADMSELVSLYRKLKGKYANVGINLTYTALIVKAVAMTLEDHPKMRTTVVDDEHVQVSERISIGVAVDLPDDNLIVPVIRDANLMDLRSIAVKLQDLAERARSKSLCMDELGNASLTVSNMGTMGITYFTPVLNPPEGALLGVGVIREQIVIEKGVMRIAPVMYLSLTHDHRTINGGPAARFLKQVVDSLQDFRWM